MTIVEIFDDEIIDNVIASSKFDNERTMYIGYDRKNMERAVANIQAYYKLIGRKMDISCIYVCRNNLNNILEEVTKLIVSADKNEEYIFDVSGGDDLILVAMGILAERHNIQMFTTSQKGKVVWQTENTKNILALDKKSTMTVRENIILHNGEIVGPNNQGGVYSKWYFDEEFISDILNMWSICRKDCVRWNKEISEIQQGMNKSDDTIRCDINATMRELINIGVLLRKEECAKEVYTYKNAQIRESLMKVGNVLELYFCIVAKQLLSKEGDIHFNDVRIGVTIDWDGIIHDVHDKVKDTRNEIDVIMMKGCIPVFVSCKNGDIDIDELYKLSTVAEQFGGKYAKKVLVCTYFGKKGSAQEYFMQRARDMKINVINEAHKLSREDLEKLLINI